MPTDSEISAQVAWDTSNLEQTKAQRITVTSQRNIFDVLNSMLINRNTDPNHVPQNYCSTQTFSSSLDKFPDILISLDRESFDKLCLEHFTESDLTAFKIYAEGIFSEYDSF